MKKILIALAVAGSSCVPASVWLVPEEPTPTRIVEPAVEEERWYLGTNDEWTLRPANEYPTVGSTDAPVVEYPVTPGEGT
jgi:hypothetical protein